MMVMTDVRDVFDIDFLQHLLAAVMIGWIFGLLIFETYIQSASTPVKITSSTIY